ncbi:MAG: Gfo/Idh/MocA family protein [Planctomycetota bacterium]|jgi:predicted dehydrogenase
MSKTTRRGFVTRSVQGAGALAAGASLVQSARPAKAAGAGEKVVLGLIGAGGRGRIVAKHMAQLENVEVKHVCDVEEARAGHAAAELEKIQGSAPVLTGDVRRVLDDRDVDAVVVATPEHWHALATVWACQAGKDVYVEKSISASIWEGRKMVEAARKYDRIVQAGTQTRSAPYMFAARDYIKEGGLGRVMYVKVFGMYSFVYGGYPRKLPPDSDPPAGLDWDRWLGPAPEQPYNRQLHRQWYGYWRFSGGNASDAIHTLDAARMVLGDPEHPKSVQCVGGRWKHEDDDGVMPDVEIATYELDEMAMSFDCTGFTENYMFKTPMSLRQADQFPFWPLNTSRIEIYGTKRMMYLGRVGGGWQVLEAGPQELGSQFGNVVAQQYGRFPDEPHTANFIDCVRSRQTPNADVEQGHRSACLEHLANLSYRLGNAKLAFDGHTETFVDNDEADGFLKPSYRKHYRVPDEV